MKEERKHCSALSNPSKFILISIGLTAGILAIVFRTSLLSYYHLSIAGQTLLELQREEGWESIIDYTNENSSVNKGPDIYSRYLNAVSHLELALLHNPQLSHAYLLLGRSHFYMGQFEKAVDAYRQYNRFRPNNPLGYLELGNVFENFGDRASAANAWTLAGVTEGDLIKAGEQARNSGRYQLASQIFNRVIWLNPESMTGWYHLAELSQYLALGLPEPSLPVRQIFRDYIKWNGGNWIVNDGFEAGFFGWGSFQPSDNDAVFGLSTTISSEGRNSLFIRGLSNGYHGGWWQALRLEEGDTFRLSTDIRVIQEGNLQVTVLYWESYLGGEPIGHHLEHVIANDLDWTTLETEIIIPRSDQQRILIYPALVQGEGRVWIDNVRLVQSGS